MERFKRESAAAWIVLSSKFDSQGNGIFSTLIGGGSDDQAFAIAVDGFGNSILPTTLSDSYPQANASFQHSRHGDLDAFVTEITADGLSRPCNSTFAAEAAPI